MKQGREAYIAFAIRTPVGKRGGMFKHERPDNLLAAVLSAILKKNPTLPPKAIDDVVVGCAMQEAEQAFNIARISLLLAGYPARVPGMTVNRLCASGLQSIAIAAERICLNQAEVMVAGGVESMSLIPMTGHRPALNPRLFDDQHIAIAYGMGITAENVATHYRISGDAQNHFALSSHRKACAAIQQGAFTEEILPYHLVSTTQQEDSEDIKTAKQTLTTDEGPRTDTSADALRKLKPVFAENGSVTAGNSSQMSDGAAALLICSEKALVQYDLQPMARYVGYAVTGVAPEIMGIGPIYAIPKVLEQCKMKQEQLSWIELNEAFAAQSLAVVEHLKLAAEVVNPLGGAIALGHPLGASGAIRTTTLLHGMQKNKLHYGMTTMCVGTGMGAAAIFENIL
ncbi:MAG: acetyl-CoA C-acyltransferase [Chromatiales bacterium]|nr:acetyl-CoA C-acyltransferase [Chromatiales bacterium]